MSGPRQYPRQETRSLADADPQQTHEEQEPGKVDLVSILYVFGGSPVIVLYLVVLFWFARSCNAPA